MAYNNTIPQFVQPPMPYGYSQYQNNKRTQNDSPQQEEQEARALLDNIMRDYVDNHYGK